jgi:eukaryotic-like serine/threonine-protein kinase
VFSVSDQARKWRLKGIPVDQLNRDLLVAVLAVLNDAIPRAGFAMVLKSWSEQRDRPLAEVLKAMTGLDDERLRALECLAAVHLKTHQDDLQLSLRALGAQEFAANVMTQTDDGELRTLLNSTLGCEVTIPMDEDGSGDRTLGFKLGSESEAQASPSGKDERFEKIRPHAKGGIGEVWLARDSELQREVAIKEIQPQFAGREDQRARFVQEAEITGSLEHPGVVPVYSLGRNAEGRPYYAMRFIRGESLQLAIQRFHHQFVEAAPAKEVTTNEATADRVETKNADVESAGTIDADQQATVGSKWGIEFRQLIGRFLDVCDAIDYAHSRGVLHRDLKPANIMLGPYGETLVVDWGLAKKMGTIEPPREADPGDFEPPAEEPSATTPERTQQGTTIGTPAYMSPEQATGAIDQLGPASDVYSLGASLYELIAGKAPFHEKKVSDVLVKVIAGDFLPPRAVDRTIPLPLEAICLMAMANKPKDRYGSVRALAQDLEHWLADEPTVAYPESRFEKMTRWFRRHRALTFVAAAALVGISMVAIIAALFIEGARRREEVARVEAEINFKMAQDAVDNYLTNVSENTLLREQESVDLRGLRRDLLKSALPFYERFVSQRKDDPLLRGELARAYYRVGQITREIDSRTQAMSAFRSAQGIWEPLVEAQPKNRELSSNLAECFLAIGILDLANGEFRAALTTLGRSRAILERLWQENPKEPRYQSSLADCYSQFGIAFARLDEPDQSLAILDKARAIQQGLVERYPESLTYKQGLAANLNVIGFAQYKQKATDAALKTFHDVQDLCQVLLKESAYGPKPSWLLNLLALSQQNIGNIHKENGDIEKALPFFKEALKYRSDLVGFFPSVTQFREKLAVSYREIAELERKAHQDANALPSIRKSIEVYGDLVRSQPDNASYRHDLAWMWDALGLVHDEARNNEEAMGAFQAAVREQGVAISKAKLADGYRWELSFYLDNLGEQYVDLGRPKEGLPHLKDALRIRRELCRAHPETAAYADYLGTALITLGNIERHLGEPAAARDLFAEARTALAKRLSSAPLEGELVVRHAAALLNEAAALADLGQPETAKPLLEEAATRLRTITNGAGRDHEPALARERLSETLWELARVLRDLEPPLDAEHVSAERSNLWKSRPPDELVELALKHLSQASVIGYGKTLLPAPAEAVRDLGFDQAASEVILACSLGLKDLGKLEASPEWPLLLRRRDVKSAIRRLETPDAPAGVHQVKESENPRVDCDPN